MCNPVLMMAAMAIGEGARQVGEKNAAEAQEEILHQQRLSQAEEIRDAAEAELGERTRQGRRERARMKVAAGEGGVGGNSFEAGMFNSVFQQSLDGGLIIKNAANQQRASGVNYKTHLSSVQKPTFASAGLQIGMAGGRGYMAGGG